MTQILINTGSKKKLKIKKKLYPKAMNLVNKSSKKRVSFSFNVYKRLNVFHRRLLAFLILSLLFIWPTSISKIIAVDNVLRTLAFSTLLYKVLLRS